MHTKNELIDEEKYTKLNIEFTFLWNKLRYHMFFMHDLLYYMTHTIGLEIIFTA